MDWPYENKNGHKVTPDALGVTTSNSSALTVNPCEKEANPIKNARSDFGFYSRGKGGNSRL